MDFPTVTVCPPKETHTALNYDLMKNENKFLTKEDRNNLQMSCNKFIESSHHHFINAMLETVNPSNLRTMYHGFQSVPQAFMQKSFKTIVWNKFGSLATPSFGEKYDESYYRDDTNFHVVLEYPEHFAEQVGNVSLVILLEVDIREDKGWREKVRFTEVPKYKLYTEKKSWVDAEAHCQKEGGHLASILTEKEQKVVRDDGVDRSK